MCLFIAVDCAARTRPSNSAPLKFLVSTASSEIMTSPASSWWVRIRAVWMLSICTRPFSSGKPKRDPHREFFALANIDCSLHVHNTTWCAAVTHQSPRPIAGSGSCCSTLLAIQGWGEKDGHCSSALPSVQRGHRGPSWDPSGEQMAHQGTKMFKCTSGAMGKEEKGRNPSSAPRRRVACQANPSLFEGTVLVHAWQCSPSLFTNFHFHLQSPGSQESFIYQVRSVGHT